jgi:hypothetical protein
MLRQLGAPTFFLTLSPAEIDWIPLMIILQKVVNKKPNFTESQVALMSKQERIDLVASDPVTVARYFETRMRHTMQFF